MKVSADNGVLALSDAAEAFLRNHPDEVETTAAGKLRFVLTGMEFPASANQETLERYLSGRAMKRAQTQKANAAYDFDSLLPNIVPHKHKNSDAFLYCQLTNKTLPRDAVVLEKHINGRRYCAALKRLEHLRLQREHREARKAERAAKAKEAAKARRAKKAQANGTRLHDHGDDGDGLEDDISDEHVMDDDEGSDGGDDDDVEMDSSAVEDNDSAIVGDDDEEEEEEVEHQERGEEEDEEVAAVEEDEDGSSSRRRKGSAEDEDEEHRARIPAREETVPGNVRPGVRVGSKNPALAAKTKSKLRRGNGSGAASIPASEDTARRPVIKHGRVDGRVEVKPMPIGSGLPVLQTSQNGTSRNARRVRNARDEVPPKAIDKNARQETIKKARAKSLAKRAAKNSRLKSVPEPPSTEDRDRPSEKDSDMRHPATSSKRKRSRGNDRLPKKVRPSRKHRTLRP